MTISTQELQAKLGSSEPPALVEALGSAYFADAHLPGAINIPPDQVDRPAPRLLPDLEGKIVGLAQRHRAGIRSRRSSARGYGPIAGSSSPRCNADADEAVGEHAGRPAVQMKPIGGEPPRPQCLGGITVAPFCFQPGPQQRRRRSQRDAASTTGLGGGEFFGRHRPFDAQHPAVEVAEPQRCQLTPESAARRTTRRSCSAGRRSWRARVRPSSPATAYSTAVSAAQSSWRTSSSLSGRRGSTRPGPRMLRIGCTSMIRWS